jgi:SnoaL-like domain
MTDSEKLQWLYDREQIKEAVYIYPVSIDTHNWKLFRSIFTDQIDVLLTDAARAERPRQIVDADKFTRTVDRVISSFRVTQHFLTDYHIEVKGDDATCFCYMQARICRRGISRPTTSPVRRFGTWVVTTPTISSGPRTAGKFRSTPCS